MFILTFTLDIKYILILLWKFKSSPIYLTCDWLKNKINPIFNLLVLEF